MINTQRHLPLFIAAILPLLIFSWFIPMGVIQVDLWLLWAVAMCLVGLPMMFLELALARRSGQTPWQGMQKLTRESDTAMHWRLFSPLSVLLAILLGAGVIVHFAERFVAFTTTHNLLPNVPSYAIAFGLTMIALILSPLKHRLLMIAAIIIAVSAVASLALGNWHGLAITQTSLGEWAMAVVMALFSMGIGTGLYWFAQSTTATSDTPTNPLTPKVLPIWLSQLIFGAVAFFVVSTPMTAWISLIACIGVLMVAAFLFHYAASQLAARFGLLTGTAILAVLALALCAAPSHVIGHGVVVVGLLSALILAVFAGWLMKISHLRKSLNFKTELRYSLWRIAIRWLVPLAIISALIGWFI